MFAKIPGFVPLLFPKRIWKDKAEGKKLFLTFDDGPIPEITPWVLQELKKYHAKATFFCIGDNIEKHSVIFKQILQEGHAAGNHTFSHLNGWKTHNKKYLKDVLLAENTIFKESKNQNTPKLFRPPYGKITGQQVRELERENYKIVMWEVLSMDYNTKIHKQKCFLNVAKNAVSGSIIVFHDSKKAEKNLKFVLPKILEHYSKQGFNFEKL